jgi:hypothetical protein
VKTAARELPEAPPVYVGQVKDGTAEIGVASIPFGCLPLVIRGLVSHWPAFRIWNADHLTSRLGSCRVECFVSPRNEGSFLQQASSTTSMTFADFIAHVFGTVEQHDRLYYLHISTAHPSYEVLAEDFEIPQLLDAYNPDASGIWIGQRGNVTPFHHDWWHSFLAQVSGRKRYTIVSPQDAGKLQRSWPAASRYDLAPAPFVSDEDTTLGNLEAAFEGVLEPGEMLYIPPYWFHQIETLDDGNVSLPIRFDSDLSPGPHLFQLSQDSTLREITNRNVDATAELVESLRGNRRSFAQKEKEFVDAFVKTRQPSATAAEVLSQLGERNGAG